MTLDLSHLPNFCAHEHWGSIQSIITSADGFRADMEQGATPHRPTRLFDILLDPYFGGFLWQAGCNLDDDARQAGANNFTGLAGNSPARALAAIRPALRAQQLTGAWQCLRRGLLHLYGVDVAIDDEAAINSLDAAITNNYTRMFSWYEEVMTRVNFSGLIRPVHPDFYARRQSPETAAHEARFTRTILRVDDLLGLWSPQNTRRDTLAAIAGIDPHDAASWRAFIAKLFDLASQAGATGIKQLQAYSRALDFQLWPDDGVTFRGDLNPEQLRQF